ncbi:MAG: hypothetical protein U1E29_13770 [Coriobacteriia bacterium]|nr:hypothetical protein [Coriobacteriia bacterium]
MAVTDPTLEGAEGDAARDPGPGARSRIPALLTVGLVMVLLLIILDSTAGLHPAACGACHSAEVLGTQETAHAEATCLSCHLESGAWSLPGFKIQQWFVMYPAQITGSSPQPSRDVSRHACLGCHESMTAPGIVERSGVRMAHLTCAPPPGKCSGCHGTVSHGEAVRWGGQPDMDSCVRCHRVETAPVDCDVCHEGRLEVERLRRGVWRVTHGPEWSATHAMGSYDTCGTCHTSDFCIKCHQVAVPHPASFGSTHGSFATQPDSSCDSCHRIESFCDDCHGVEMPHPQGYLVGHKDVASGVQDPTCYPCHETKGCTNCHTRHDAHPRGEDMRRSRGGG